jgi:replicative DNA helicase
MSQPAMTATRNALAHHPEAEEALLGSILINPAVFPDIANSLQANDFYLHRHRFLWETFTALPSRRSRSVS